MVYCGGNVSNLLATTIKKGDSDAPGLMHRYHQKGGEKTQYPNYTMFA